MSSVCSLSHLNLSGFTLAIFPHDEGGQEAGSVGPRCCVCMIVNVAILILSTQIHFHCCSFMQHLDFPFLHLGVASAKNILARLKQN
jgi:hypothetical protein